MRALGGGGFGEVVLATHDASGARVAIKYLHPDLLHDPDHAAMFRAEAAVLCELTDPHVVRLYEYVEGAAGAAIVMELVAGVTLAKILERQGTTTPEAALVILFGSLLGLAAAHARGVVHRDYKPANVLVDAQGASKLTDFGIAALAGGRPVPAGTLAYMPPEQFEGALANPAADVYAATVTFYQCLAGRVPFDGQTAAELYAKHKSGAVPMDPVPEPLRPLIARGMAKDPEDRPSDAGRLAAELRDAATGSYGKDWENRGRSHLAEAAALLLALLWPSGSAPAVQGGTVVHTPLADPAAKPAAAAHQARAAHHGLSRPSLSAEARHRWHLLHLQHLAHLRNLRSEGDGGDNEPTRYGKRPRSRLRLAVAGGAAITVVTVAAAAAAVLASSHAGRPPLGHPSRGGGGTAAAVDTTGAAGPTRHSALGSASASPSRPAPVFPVSFTATIAFNDHYWSGEDESAQPVGGTVTEPSTPMIFSEPDGGEYSATDKLTGIIRWHSNNSIGACSDTQPVLDTDNVSWMKVWIADPGYPLTQTVDISVVTDNVNAATICTNTIGWVGYGNEFTSTTPAWTPGATTATVKLYVWVNPSLYVGTATIHWHYAT